MEIKSFNDYWGRAIPAAQDFLETGRLSGIFGGRRCNTSSDCGSGYICQEGICVWPDSTGDSGTGGSPGSCGSASSSTPDCKNANSSTGCTTGTCGENNGYDCCGVRTCRYSAFGVQCFCGRPEPSGCTSYCTTYYAVNGSVPSICGEDTVCSECEYCDLFFETGTCREKTANQPCHCGQPAPACHKCNEDGTFSRDETACGECCQLQNYECKCGKTINITCCFSEAQLKIEGSYGSYRTCVNVCQERAEAECDEICPPGNPCDTSACQSRTQLFNFPCNYDIQVSCGSGKICRETGRITMSPSSCQVLYDECDASDLQNKKCQTDSDCPVNYKCDPTISEGKCDGCYPDPYGKYCDPNLAPGPDFKHGVCRSCDHIFSGSQGYCFCPLPCNCGLVCAWNPAPDDPDYMGCHINPGINAYFPFGYTWQPQWSTVSFGSGPAGSQSSLQCWANAGFIPPL